MNIQEILAAFMSGSLTVLISSWVFNSSLTKNMNKGNKRSVAVAISTILSVLALWGSVRLGYLPSPLDTAGWISQGLNVALSAFGTSQVILGASKSGMLKSLLGIKSALGAKRGTGAYKE